MGEPTDAERDRLLARVRVVYGCDHVRTEPFRHKRAPIDRWRVVSRRWGVVALGPTEIEALSTALRESRV